MNSVPTVISGSCLNEGWCRYLLHVLDVPDRKCSPAVVSIDCRAHNDQDSAIRSELDQLLEKSDCYPTATTAMTIFPEKLWRRHSGLSASDFCTLCLDRFVPRLKALHQANRNGLYFERMMGYQASKNGEPKVVNQIQAVIDRLNGPKKFRVTGLQLSCFDPGRDHTAQPQRGFPCLQQVGVNYDGDDSISVTAFYPAHNVFDRAYGNFLGLIHLGRFIANHAGLKMSHVNCYSMSPRLGKVNRGDIRGLARSASGFLKSLERNSND